MNIFFFNDTATTEIYTLSLHDALPIFTVLRNGSDTGTADVPTISDEEVIRMIIGRSLASTFPPKPVPQPRPAGVAPADRKSTRLNSSHANISYAVFCLKKKNNVLYFVH